LNSLETERLVLEPLVPAHAAKLFPYLRDPQLYEFLDSEPPKSVAILLTQYRRWEPRRSPDGSQSWLNWAARALSGEYVGWFQATVYPDGRADLAYLVFSGFQRRGYAIEACRSVVGHLKVEYRIRALRATIHPANEASISLARRLGLTQTSEVGRDLRFEANILE